MCGAAQLDAVGVVQVGDQRAHVGARGALDLERRRASSSRHSSSNRVTVDLALGHLDLLAARGRARRRAFPDLHGAVGGRALA